MYTFLLLSSNFFLDSNVTASSSSHSTSSSSTEANKSAENQSQQETKPKVTLEERVARGEAQVGPTVPLRQGQENNENAPTGIKQVFPPVANQEHVETNSSNLSTASEQSKTSENNASTKDAKPAQTASQEAITVTPEEEKKIVEDVIKKLTPLVEELVANEIRRIRRGLSDDNDEAGFAPFPFLFGGGPMFARSGQGSFNNDFQVKHLINDLDRFSLLCFLGK